MGNMREKCKECDGKGFIEEAPSEKKVDTFKVTNGTMTVLDDEPEEKIFTDVIPKVKSKEFEKKRNKSHDGKES